MHHALTEWAEGRTGDPWVGAYQPRLSIGINTGPVVTGLFSGGGAHNYTAVGDAVNVAARLQGQCEPGRILVGPTTYRLARHLFDFDEETVMRVKGRSEPVRARYVRGVKQLRGRLRGVGGASTPLVGRAAELDALRERWGRARAGRSIISLVVGPPGIGKTRLVEELAAAEGLGPTQVARGRSYPYARATPWEPLAELVREMYGVGADADPEAAARQVAQGAAGHWEAEEIASLAAILGAPATADPVRGPDERQERAAAVLRRTLSWSGRAPRLLVLEDLHWADGSTLAFLSQLSTADLSGPLLLVLITRRPVAGEEQVARLLASVPDRIELASLSPEETRSLIDGILGDHRLEEHAIRTIVERADGMPLFVEELLKTLMASGALHRDEEGHWVRGGDWTLAVPDTIESVLSTRIDALAASTKRVLQYAAIVGRRFWPGILREALVEGPVEADLEALHEARFIRERTDSLLRGEPEYAFEHLMLHEVAYDGILRSARETLHEAVARWLEDHIVDPSPETDDLIAYHYERSGAPQRAIPFLERGARHARARGGLEDARAHIARAMEVSDDGHERARLLLDTEELAALAGDAEARARALDALETAMRDAPDGPLEGEVRLRRAGLAFDSGDLAATRSWGQAALSSFETLGDVSRQGDALRLLGREAHRRGAHEMAETLYARALECERAAGDRWGEAEILDLQGLLEVDRDALEAAVSTFDRVLDLCGELGAPILRARTLAHRATALRWMGCLEEAERSASEALSEARASGSPRTVGACEEVLGGILVDARRPAEAEEHLRRSLRTAMRMQRPDLEAAVWLELSWLADGSRGLENAREAVTAAVRGGNVHVEVLARSRIAETSLELGRIADAERASSEAMEALKRLGTIVGPEERIYAAHARVLEAAGRTDAARETRERLVRLIDERARRIEDPARRAAYLSRHAGEAAPTVSTPRDGARPVARSPESGGAVE